MTGVRKLSINPTLRKSLSEIIDRFLAFKGAQALALRSIEDYKATFKEYRLYLDSDDLDMEKLEDALIKLFTRYKSMSSSYYNVRYKNLSCFFRWAIEQEYLAKNPLKRLGLKAKRDEGKVRHHEPDNIAKMLKVIDLGQYTGLRDYALILLTLDCGIRPNEAFHLRINDIDLVHRTVTISSSIAKTKTARTLPLSGPVIQTLDKLISVRFDQFEDYLFISCDGNPLNRNSWNRRLTIYCALAEIPNISPYDLRHTFAVLYLRAGGHVFSLQKIMGHADLSMTKRYVKLADSDIFEQHTSFSPVNQFVKRATRIKRKL